MANEQTGMIRGQGLRLLLVVGLALACRIGLFPSSGYAASTAWVNSDFSQIRLVAVRNGVGLQAGLHIRLEPGWKTYWRSPGDSGVPTVVNWSTSKNISVSGLNWPVPGRAVVSGYQNFVYEDEIVLPLNLKVHDAVGTMRIIADVNYAVCKEICVPLQATLELELDPDVADKAINVHLRLLDKFKAKVPTRNVGPDFRLTDIELEMLGRDQVLVVVIESQSPMNKPDVFVEAPQPFSFAVPDFQFSEDRRRLSILFKVIGGGKKHSLAGKRVVVTAADAGQAIEVVHQLKKN